MSNAAQIAESIDQEIARLRAEILGLETARDALNGAHVEQVDKTTKEKRQRVKRASQSLVVKAHKSQEKKTRGKLTQEIADQIRQINGSAATIAKDFGISTTMVYNIRSGKSWASAQEVVTEPETTALTSVESIAADDHRSQYESLSHRQLVALHRERKIPTGHDRRKTTLVANLVADDQLAEDVTDSDK